MCWIFGVKWFLGSDVEAKESSEAEVFQAMEPEGLWGGAAGILFCEFGGDAYPS